MADAKNQGKKPRGIPLSEALILLGFVLLLSAGIVTVVVPELQEEPESKASGSNAAHGELQNHVKKP